MNEDRQLLGPLSQGILRDFWRDRTGNWSMENMQKFVVGMSKPPWWRLIARWKWRKAARNLCKPRPALVDWEPPDLAPEVAELLKPASDKLTQDYLDGMYTYLKAQEPELRWRDLPAACVLLVRHFLAPERPWGEATKSSSNDETKNEETK